MMGCEEVGEVKNSSFDWGMGRNDIDMFRIF
jgi:hypothetical protein